MSLVYDYILGRLRKKDEGSGGGGGGVTLTGIINVDAGLPEVIGSLYQSYANACAYIQSITTPSYFNRWAVVINGAMPSNAPVLCPWIYPMGYDGKTALVSEGNWTNTGGVGNTEAYMMFNLSTGGVDPSAGTTIQVWDSILNDQETTVGTGTIWLKRSNMFDGDNNANLNTCTLIIDDISQAVINNGGSIICYGAYYLTVNGTSIGFLQTYGAGGQIYFNNDVVIGGCFIYGSEIYGVNFGALALLNPNISLQTITGSQLKKLITSAQPISALTSTRTITITSGFNQIANTIIYDVDINVAAICTLETLGSMRGIGTESISTIIGVGTSVWINRTDIFNNAESGLEATDLEDAINEIVTSIAEGAGQQPDATEFIALTNTNGEIGTWVDVSDNAKDDQTNLTIFPGVAAENSFYLGSDNIFTALEFFNLQTPMVLGAGEIAVEYWDGAAWLDIDVMETDWNAPHLSSANVTFENNTDFSQRVDFHPDSTLKILDGNNKHWLRWRIVTAITTSPVVRNAQVEFSRIRINPNDGFVELFGQAEKFVDLTQQYTYDAVGFISANHDVLAGPNTSMTILNNMRANSGADGSGNKLILPLDQDTSKTLFVIVRFGIDSNVAAGDVEIQVHTSGYRVGYILDGTLLEKVDKQVISIPANSENEVFQTVHRISVEEFLAGTSVVFNTIRDARGTNANDTLPGSIYITDVLIQSVSWRL